MPKNKIQTHLVVANYNKCWVLCNSRRPSYGYSGDIAVVDCPDCKTMAAQYTDAWLDWNRKYKKILDMVANLDETAPKQWKSPGEDDAKATTSVQPKKRKSTSLIYEPGGITEFARLALNREVGCVHDCKYCYGPASMHVKREDWTKPRAKDNYLTNLLFDLRKREKKGLPKHQVLMEYSGDCYGDPADTLTGESIKLLHDFGYGVCILTKAGMNAVKDIALFDPKIDCFGSTITTFDPVELAEWEPKAPCPQDRLAALKEFHDAGVYTWISMEPIISPATSLQVIDLTHQCVDHYKTGLMNVRGVPLPDGYGKHDWRTYTADFIKMCESYGRSWFAKHTLESYLPVGAVNEKFRPMYHG